MRTGKSVHKYQFSFYLLLLDNFALLAKEKIDFSWKSPSIGQTEEEEIFMLLVFLNPLPPSFSLLVSSLATGNKSQAWRRWGGSSKIAAIPTRRVSPDAQQAGVLCQGSLLAWKQNSVSVPWDSLF